MLNLCLVYVAFTIFTFSYILYERLFYISVEEGNKNADYIC